MTDRLLSLRHANGGEHGFEKLPEDPHRRAVVNLDDGSDVAYRDVRRFGTWLVLEDDELDDYLAARLGEEPLGAALTTRQLAQRLAGRRDRFDAGGRRRRDADEQIAAQPPAAHRSADGGFGTERRARAAARGRVRQRIGGIGRRRAGAGGKLDEGTSAGDGRDRDGKQK